MNQFLANLHKGNTLTENGALSNSSTGSLIADQFGKAGSYRGRNVREVFNDQARLHAEYGIDALRFVFYLRMVTRKIKFEDGVTQEVQKGQGNRDESLKRLLWYYVNQPALFFENIWLVPYFGRYKDIFDLMYLAKSNGIEIGENVLEEAIRESDLFLKYMPLVRARSKAKSSRANFNNEVAKVIAKYLGLSYKEMRQMKAKGRAHEWQQFISKKMFNKIDFSKIPGKALLNLVSGKFLKNHNLEITYQKWIEKQPVAKFTGYVFELGAKVKHSNSVHMKMTIDKQFEGLLALNKGGISSSRRVICAIDRSGSMLTNVAGTTAMNIAESLGIYFAALMEGPFKNWVIRFSQRSEWVQLKGTFSEQKLQMQWGDCPSNTDFESVIDSLVRMRMQHPNIPESDFPNTLLVVSDMQFDSPGLRGGYHSSAQTNYQVSVQKLRQVFSASFCNSFSFIWWDCTGRKADFPQTLDEPGGYVLSGFDGAIISLLLGAGKTAEGKTIDMEQLIKDALSQESLLLVQEP